MGTNKILQKYCTPHISPSEARETHLFCYFILYTVSLWCDGNVYGEFLCVSVQTLTPIKPLNEETLINYRELRFKD